MKIGIVSGAAYCIPLLQALVNGHIQASVFADACSGAEDLTVIRHFVLEKPGMIVNHHRGLQVTCKDKMIIAVSMLNMDGTFVPARHAAMFGFIQGQCFGS